MTFSSDGEKLASGGVEGEIIIWDRIAEVGLYRLKGHRGPITGLHIIPTNGGSREDGEGWLISCAKDGWIKVWDLTTQHCVQTVVAGRGEILGMDIKEEKGVPGDDGVEVGGRWTIVTGGGDGEGKVWGVENDDLNKGFSSGSKEVCSSSPSLTILLLHSSQLPSLI